VTRVGWIVLLLIVAAGVVFASLLRFGGAALPSLRAAAASTAPPPGGPITLIVPVTGVARAQLTDTWGQARAEGREHHGTDIPAPRGTPVLAAAAGTVEKLFQSGRGGTTIYERSADRRWTFYYAHLAGYAPGLHEGQALATGQLIGFVGDTGDAGAGNTHLHFGLTRTDPAQHWYQGEDLDAFPYLGSGSSLPRY
jgi:peptidoglycan LD-endopeptidase LytH